MAEQPAVEQADPGAPQPEVSRPHDKYFRKVFSDTEDAASLLRSCVPPALGRTLRWATLTHLPGRFVSDAWHDSEADLLFSVEREGGDAVPVLLYVLLEHQSTPDRKGVRRGSAARGVRAGDAAGRTPEVLCRSVAEERAGTGRRPDELR